MSAITPKHYNITSSFDSENNTNENHEILGITALWKSVITQALVDASNNSGKRSEQVHKRRAIAWLKEADEDFALICQMANMDPKVIYKKTMLALYNGCKWRNDQRKVRNLWD